MTRRLILGTAGHIDHGKTALVRALTGVDTDRLVEEKERGITIDLGFAELAADLADGRADGPGAGLADDAVRFGVVDVPGHEGFVRNMLAGATGMDVAILVVAADEGVMPQTREHLAILDLLEVRRLVVALTKCDVADPDWADLVEEEVRETLADTGFADAPVVRTAAPVGTGLDDLRRALVEAAADVARDADDILLLPIDRVFTVRGTGTVITGTLVSGRIRTGDTVRIRPGGPEARVRGLQIHGADAAEAEAGARVAVAVAGSEIDTDTLARGQALLAEPRWEASRMLTARVRVLAGTGWSISHGQRVRVHVGTAEVMARCAVLADGVGEPREELAPRDEGWIQLRLESEAVARVGMRFVIRAYSPVTTIGGGIVAEVHPPRRRAPLSREDLAGITDRIAADPAARLASALAAHGARGLHADELPVETGLPPAVVSGLLGAGLLEAGVPEPGPFEGVVRGQDGTLFAAGAVRDFTERVLQQVDAVHASEPFRAGLDVARARSSAPGDAHPGFADAALDRAAGSGELVVDAGAVLRPGFEPTLSEEQRALEARLAELYAEARLEPPRLDDLPDEHRSDPAFHTILARLERAGRIVQLDDQIRIDAHTLDGVIARIREEFAGREDLGPADFREVMPVSRRHLLPILEYLDRQGVTRFDGGTRRVER